MTKLYGPQVVFFSSLLLSSFFKLSPWVLLQNIIKIILNIYLHTFFLQPHTLQPSENMPASVTYGTVTKILCKNTVARKSM